VAEFPWAEDLSTPEAAYVTVNRMAWDDPSAWQKVSIAALAERLARESRQRRTTADPEWARVLLHARIRDVIVWRDTQAAVVAELPQGFSSKKIGASVDVRYLQREDGRWLNAGNNRFVTVEEAEADFMARFDESERKAAAEQKVDPVTMMWQLRQAVRTYEVNRSVADFPPTEDLSTPEAAYATINRMDRDDPPAWQKFSIAALAGRPAQPTPAGKTTADAEWAKVLSNARIREVLVWNMTRAAVIAELPQEPSGKKIVDPIDVRHLQLENGRWLNRQQQIPVYRGQDSVPGPDRAGNWCRRLCETRSSCRRDQEAAAHLFQRLRTADYADILLYYRDGKWDPEDWGSSTQGLYMVHTNYPSFAIWCCTL
jgi:hypothetical protein